MTEEEEYKITISLNVLNHLGINLYSNIASVLAETVANAWDADALKVTIDIDKENGIITIFDNGHGMTKSDINHKFLRVGYGRRESEDGRLSLGLKRAVMGRKGIGKLSLFSIADTIEIYSIRDNEKSALLMSLPELKEQIKGTGDMGGTYKPQVISDEEINWQNGTKIVLRDLRQKRIFETSLRKKLARRFSVIGDKNDFSVIVNGDPITIADRDYFNKLENIWLYGDVELPRTVESTEHFEDTKTKSGYSVSGWIGTVKESSDLKDGTESLNQIVVMVRKKLAQEDILAEINETGIYSTYLIGEIHADFLDDDNMEDIATSSRQHIIEDDQRYIELREWVKEQLKKIQSKWSSLRGQKGKDEALKNPALKEWFNSLSPDYKSSATKLFGRINQVTVGSSEDRGTLFSHAVLAFESLKNRDNLEALEKISIENLPALTEVFGRLDDLEASLYYQIIKERIEVIRVLQNRVDDNDLEKVIQKHLFDHLWLLDPAWERATDSEYMEQRVSKIFGALQADLSEDEKSSRLDIRYKSVSGKNVIIELKRPDRVVDYWELGKQIDKYRDAMQKILDESGAKEPLEFICVLGKPLKGWENSKKREEDVDKLKRQDARVVLYPELIRNAMQSYQSYLSKSKNAGRLYDLLKNIQSGVMGVVDEGGESEATSESEAVEVKNPS
ncbi:Histidine kinase-, DNA gyrase B-, and HSP90-like ATPase [Paenibacillus sophorae]|uniref:ATP-binding protein n=1 Tax=Paenibacillus sophorae TaxID=1333845 RepID=A0A1H8TJ91_9BACL|nr:ATP-binding protein [Paenibacillus sophorae]QWU16224.1 ATP-binding protein [Paenibacillus sophorae]SEO90614.1 Histidine kinase-, DNA gyrase B-, and HSP90-like ATPase [Paenibacillus sophorae]